MVLAENLLEKGFDLITPYGNTKKKLKDFNEYDYYWLAEKDKLTLLKELKEEYHALVLENAALKNEYYRLCEKKVHNDD